MGDALICLRRKMEEYTVVTEVVRGSISKVLTKDAHRSLLRELSLEARTERVNVRTEFLGPQHAQ